MNSVQIKGNVTRRPYTSDKFAAFSIRPLVEEGERASIIDVVAFAAPVIATIGMISEGDVITVVGHLSAKKATNKDRKAIQVDGRDLWVMQIVADVVEADENPGAAF